TVARALQSVNGVSKVERVGGVEREIRVALDPDRLLALGITAGDVNRQLRATQVDVAGGRGEIGGREQAIRTLAGKQTIEDLAKTMIALPGGRAVRLDTLGTITDSIEEPRSEHTSELQSRENLVCRLLLEKKKKKEKKNYNDKTSAIGTT